MAAAPPEPELELEPELGAADGAGRGDALDALNVMTYNIHSGVGIDGEYSLERIANAIRAEHADVVLLQEVERNAARSVARAWSVAHDDDQIRCYTSVDNTLRLVGYTVGLPQVLDCVGTSQGRSRCLAQVLARLTGLRHYEYFAAVQCEHVDGETRLGAGRSQFGIAILSRWPLGQRRELRYELYMKPRLGGLLGSLLEARPKTQRNALATHLQMRSKGLWVVCTHLGMDTSGGEQSNQVRELTAWVEELPNLAEQGGAADAVVVGGDFNSPPWFDASRWMRREDEAGPLYRDLWHAHGDGSAGRTYRPGSYVAWLRVDYLYLALRRGVLACSGARTVHSVGSDHSAVVVSLRLQPLTQTAADASRAATDALRQS